MSQLAEMAMQYALASVDQTKMKDLALFGLTIITDPHEWDAELLLYNMERQFSPYAVQEAIKEARQTLKLLGFKESPND